MKPAQPPAPKGEGSALNSFAQRKGEKEEKRILNKEQGMMNNEVERNV